ncbi:MAG: aminotransferase class I/II-fold pyridoxal phosphate-dependent enzyme [Candidatus Omnitrophica bacterium]|nr:aminotransferase class I/II-fold pyridoxal phosphate-dependent enzyme [Candidatus Omnitrophota bacterium]
MRKIFIFCFILIKFAIFSFSFNFSSLEIIAHRRTKISPLVANHESVRKVLVDIFYRAAGFQGALRSGTAQERRDILNQPEVKRAVSLLQYGLSLGSTTLRNQVAYLAERLGISANPAVNIGIYQGEAEIFDILGNIFMPEGDGLVFYQKGTDNPETLFKPFLARYGAKIFEFDPYFVERNSTPSYSTELSGFEALISLAIQEGQNPRFIYLSGKGLTEAQARRIYALAETYNLIIIEDITNANPTDYLLSANDSQGRVISIGNFDKYLGAANPLSYAIAGEEIMRLMEIAIGGISLHPNAFIQPIVSEILAQNGIPFSVNVSYKPITLSESVKAILASTGADQRLKPSIIREILKGAVSDMVRMGGGVPAEEFFPYVEIAQIIENMSPEEWEKVMAGDPAINLELRSVFCRWLEERGIKADPRQVLVTNGSQQGLDLLGRWVGKEGVVFAESPTYVGMITGVAPYGGLPYGRNIRHWDLRTLTGLENLEKEIEENYRGKKIVLYVTPNFGNPPSGNMWTISERRNLLAFAQRMRLKGYDLHIVEDDPYGELNYTGQRIVDIKELDTNGTVIYFNSNSKVFSPGMRVGYIVADEKIIHEFASLMDEVGSFVPTLPQLIITKFIETGAMDRHIEFLIGEYSKRARAMEEALEEFMPEGVTWTKPEGGLFITLTVPWDIDFMAMLEEAKNYAIPFNFVPGIAFSVDGSSAHKIRLCFSTESEERITLGIKAFAELIKKHLGQ